MMSAIKRIAVVLAVALGATALMPADSYGQRRINPVKSASKGLEGKNENKNEADSIDYSKLVRSQDAEGNVVLVDTVTGREVPDTTHIETERKVPKMEKQLWYAAAVGVDIWSPVMRLFGQHYGLIEFSGEVNLHNRYIPVVEIGLGAASYTPEDNNYSYRVPVTPYFRVGMNYNFLYNSNPDYMVMAGLRYGWSHFNYEVNNVTLTDGYWNETATFNLPRQASNVSYLQVLFGIRVKLFGPISAGWSFRYQTILHKSKAEYGEPWYIPGYGSKKSSVTGSFTFTYTIPFKKKEVSVPHELLGPPEVDANNEPQEAAAATSPDSPPISEHPETEKP